MTQTIEELLQKNEALQVRLEAAEEALRAIQSGEVDALVIYREDGDRVYTLEGADHTYRTMVEKIQEGVATLLPDGMILYGNQRLAEMLAVPLESLLGSTLLPFIQPYEQKVFSALLRKGVEGSSKGEMTLHRGDGSSLPVLLTMNCVENQGECVICLVATDLTEQKRQEEILAAERLARSILEQAGEAIVVCDPHGTIIRASLAAHELVCENPLYQPFEKVFPLAFDEELPGEDFSIEEVLRGKSFRGLEIRLAAKLPARTMLLSAAPLRGDSKGITGCIVTLADISERKAAEEALRESERKYRDLIRYAPVGIYEIDFRKRRFTSINDVMCELTGYSREEMLSINPIEILDDAGKRTFQERIQAWLSGKKPEEGVEYVVKAKDGHEIYAVLNVTFKTDEAGKPIGATVIGYDITERKKAERQLLETTRRAEENQVILEAVIQQMPVGIILTDATGSQAKNNAEMDRIWRRAMLPDENIEQHAYRAFHADGSEYRPEDWPLTRALLKEEIIYGEEMTILRGDGTRGTLDVSSAPIRDKSGKIIAGIVVDMDISDRMALLAEIKHQKSLFERLIQNAPLWIGLLEGPEHRFVLANPAQHRLFPSIPEFVGRTVADIWPEQAEIFNPILDRVCQTGEPYFAVDAPWSTDHGHGPEEAFYTFSYSSLSENAGILVLSLETTEQVKARQQIEAELGERLRIERELRESQERLQMTTEAAEVGIWSLDLKTRHLYCDDQVKTMLNLTAEQTADPRFLSTLVQPEDLDKVENMVRQIIEVPDRLEAELRVNPLDGSQRWLYIRGQGKLDRDGSPLQLVGVVMDMTEQKQAAADFQADRARIEVQRRLIAQREQERQQIARDLHDGPVQELLGVTFAIQGLLMDECAPEVARQLEEIRGSVKEQVNELRAYAEELRPPTLMKFGLAKGIQSHLEAFKIKHPEIQLHFEDTSQGPLLPEETNLALFRITQETLNNIAKHAHATQVRIRFRKTLDQAILEIQDDGRGFEVPRDWLELARRRHLGLVGMRERTEALGGSLEITSQPGMGTTLRVAVPIDPPIGPSNPPEAASGQAE